MQEVSCAFGNRVGADDVKHSPFSLAWRKFPKEFRQLILIPSHICNISDLSAVKSISLIKFIGWALCNDQK